MNTAQTSSAWPAALLAATPDRDATNPADLPDAGLAAPEADLALVEVRGNDATDFLHAQFSADLVAMTPGQSVLTAWCSPKGRVLFLVRVLRTADCWALLLPTSEVETFVKRLRMFVLRAAVEINDCAQSALVLRLVGGRSPTVPTAIHQGSEDDQTWLAGERETLLALYDSLERARLDHDGVLARDWFTGQPRIAGDLGDRFLPQELNLDQHGGISFEKGCYPGQEIIARVRFRGEVKRRLARARVAGSVIPAPATRVLSADSDQAVGTVLYGTPDPGAGSAVMLVLDVAAFDGALRTETGDAVTIIDSPPDVGD